MRVRRTTVEVFDFISSRAARFQYVQSVARLGGSAKPGKMVTVFVLSAMDPGDKQNRITRWMSWSLERVSRVPASGFCESFALEPPFAPV
jgi:hypothetical protein